MSRPDEKRPLSLAPRAADAVLGTSGLEAVDTKAELFDQILESWKTALPGVDLTSVSLSVSISRLATLFNRGVEDLVRPHGFGYGELEVLFYLLSTGKPYEGRPSDLTRGCFVTSGAITGRVDRLSRLGLVTRIPSLIDRREMVVRLTRDGEKLTRRLQGITAHDSALAVALDALPQKRRLELDLDLRALLLRLETVIEGRRDDVARPNRPQQRA